MQLKIKELEHVKSKKSGNFSGTCFHASRNASILVLCGVVPEERKFPQN
jgi:hypothetical protein